MAQHALQTVGGNAAHSSRHKWLTVLGRAGYAVRGVVYLLIGGLALLAAFSRGGETTGSRGALRSLLDEPFGKTILGVIGLGLIGYSVWRFCQSVLNADNHDHDFKGAAVRIGLFISSVLHLLLAFYAIDLAWLGGGGGGGDGGRQEAVGWLLSRQWGVWVLGLIGAGIIGAGVAQFIKGVSARFERWLDIDPQKQRWVRPVCQVGLIARGIVFVLLGAMVIVAAWQTDPDDAVGLGGLLSQLRQQPYGPWLLGAVALGLLAFAVYSFVEARYRRISLQ